MAGPSENEWHSRDGGGLQVALRFEVYEEGAGLAFQFDKDKDAYKSHQHMRHPYLSSILYLTSSDEDRLLQGKAHSRSI